MKKFKVVLLVLSIFLFLYLYLSKPVVFEKLSNSIEDIKYSLRNILNVNLKPNPNVVVITIDEKSINHFGRWPWDRKLIGDLIKKLKDAKVVGLDIVFSERTNPESDKYLANVIFENGNVISGFFFRTEATQIADDEIIDYLENCSIHRYEVLSEEVGIPEFPYVETNIPEILEASLSCAFFNIQSDIDGIYRHYPITYIFEGLLFPSLAIQLYRYYTNSDIFLKLDKSGVNLAKLGNLELSGNKIRLNFYKKMKTISAYDILNENFDPTAIKDKVAIIGITEIGVFDVRPTPIDTITPGVYLHYTFLSNLLNNEFLRSSDTHNILLGIFLLISAFFISNIKKTKRRIALFIVLLVFPFIYSSYMFLYQNIWINSTYPFFSLFIFILGVEIYNYLTIEIQAKKIRNAFSKYVSPRIVEQIVKNPENLKLGGVSKEITVLFSDIRGFTSLTEKIPPEKVAKLLNIYLDEITKVILKNDGMVDKYIGDAVMALFNAVIDQEDHADKACKTALDMVKALEKVNKKLEKENLPNIDIGIGINTGKAVVGNLGSALKFEYTAVGDTVNLASRIEGLTRIYNVKIIISHHTKEKTKSKEMLFRLLDKVKVKGKEEPVLIYEVMENNEANKNLKEKYEEALELYLNKEFEKAKTLFSNLWNTEKDYPSYMLYKRCLGYIENPPKNWDGSYEFKTK